jgi:hypothetical protein
MLERTTDSDSHAGSSAHEKTVVLLLPELLGNDIDPANLRATLTGAAMPIRVLLCFINDDGGPLLAAVSGLGFDLQLLLGPAVATPTTTVPITRALPGTSADDLTELALAFSDIVMVAPEVEQTVLSRNITSLGKSTVVPGASLRPIASPKFLHDLDPEAAGWWRAWGCKSWGRVEQGVLELLAFNWLGRPEGGVAESKKRLRRCVGHKWRPSVYFAPDEWKELAPDRTAVAPSAKIVQWFETLDRSALYGSYIHRDLIWLEHFGAAFAVLAAVAGALTEYPRIWGVVEFITLFTVGAMVLSVRHTWLQDRWTACRFGAEQLRIARMSLPLLVLPPALATKDSRPAGEEDDKETEYEYQALTLIKRIVREHGLPQLDPDLTPERAARWLDLIVDDQITYHHRNERKLEHAEIRLRFATQTIFFISVVAVVAHFLIEHAHWLLLFTAAGPAFAAALEGTITRLGIVHRAALSVDAAKDLREVHADIEVLLKASPPIEQAWSEVRRLAYSASRAMGRENTSWHGLVRRYRDDL